MKKGVTVMIENFGLLDGSVQGTKIYLMSADKFTAWLAKASNAQQAWVTAQGFTAKPGKAITFAAVDALVFVRLLVLLAVRPRRAVGTSVVGFVFARVLALWALPTPCRCTIFIGIITNGAVGT